MVVMVPLKIPHIIVISGVLIIAIVLSVHLLIKDTLLARIATLAIVSVSVAWNLNSIKGLGILTNHAKEVVESKTIKEIPQVNGSYEITFLSVGMNRLIDLFKKYVKELGDVLPTLMSQSTQVKQASSQISTSIQQVSQAIQEVAKGVQIASQRVQELDHMLKTISKKLNSMAN